MGAAAQFQQIQQQQQQAIAQLQQQLVKPQTVSATQSNAQIQVWRFWTGAKETCGLDSKKLPV